MYSVLPSFVLGFHGCDKSVAEKVLSGKTALLPSSNNYDWLGSGIYFWENSPERAFEYAQLIKKNPGRCKEKIVKPCVLGAVIAMGHCLNLLDYKDLQHVKNVHDTILKPSLQIAGVKLSNKTVKGCGELLLRHLDCAVIEATCALRTQLVIQRCSSIG